MARELLMVAGGSGCLSGFVSVVFSARDPYEVALLTVLSTAAAVLFFGVVVNAIRERR